MAKKVFLGVGHGGKDSGAVGILVEKDINLKMATACRDYLLARGIEVLMSRVKDENDPLEEEIRECNAYNPDLAIDCHNNAGGGDGFEVYYTLSGGTGKILAQNIEAEVKAIGQNSRGCKTRANSYGTDYYGFIRETNCPAVICEGVFVDNKADATQADTDEECKAFGEAYARGILKTLGISENITTSNNNTTVPNNNATSGITYKVQVGAYSVKSNADAMLAKVKAAGFDTYMVQADGMYKIQVGAYNLKSNAEAMQTTLKLNGFDAFITTEQGKAVSGTAATAPVKEITVGSTVKLTQGAKTYDNKGLASFVYNRNHQVKEVNGDRVVITYNGTVVAAVRKSDLTLV